MSAQFSGKKGKVYTSIFNLLSADFDEVKSGHVFIFKNWKLICDDCLLLVNIFHFICMHLIASYKIQSQPLKSDCTVYAKSIFQKVNSHRF